MLSIIYGLASVLSCATNDLQAIDIVTIDYRDEEFGMRLGFSGKQTIHLVHVAVVQKAFTSSKEKIAYAKRIVETFEASQKEGRGVYLLDGKIIDMPLLKHAQKMLARTKAASE